MRVGLQSLLFVLAALFGFLTFLAAIPGAIDDAFIVLIYARHLVEGLGFQYNVGEGALDGFTSMFDMLLKALAIRVTGADPIRIAWFGALFWHMMVVLVGILLAVASFRRAERARPALLILAVIALATSVPLAEASSFLLETGLYVLLNLLLVRQLVIARWESAGWVAGLVALCGAMILCRPEALLLVMIVLAWSHRAPVGDAETKGRRGPTRGALVAVGGFVAAYIAWRVGTFGYWAPNTYYAKTSESRLLELQDGLAYAWDYTTQGTVGFLVPLILIAWALSFSGKWKDQVAQKQYELLSGMALVSLAAVLAGGGDCYPGARFLAGSLTLLVLAISVATFHGVLPRAAGALVLAGVVLAQFRWLAAGFPVIVYRLRGNIPLRDASFECDREVCERLGRALGTGRLSQSDFQRFKYFSPATRAVDLHGLNHRDIAHTPFAGPVRFGKFSMERAANEACEIFVYGPKTYPIDQPMAHHTLEQVLFDPQTAATFVGWTAARDPSSEKLLSLYRTASLPVCHQYFNFLVRHDMVPAVEAVGALVSPR